MSPPRPTTIVYRPERTMLLVALALPALLMGAWVLMADQRKHGIDQFPIGECIVAIFCAIFAAWEWTQRILITRSLDGVILHIEQRRLFSQARHSVHLIPAIQDVAVEFDPMGEGSTHRVVLVLSDNTRIPLTESFNSKGRHHERVAREIRALLQLRDQNAPVTVFRVPFC